MSAFAVRQHHAHVGRNYLEDHHVVQREPALLSLNVALPSLPLLNDVITALIPANNPQPTTSVQAPMPTTPTTPPVPTAAPGSGGSGGGNSSGNGGNGNGNGGSGNNGSGNGGNGTNGGGNSGSGTNGGGNGGGGTSGSGNGNGGGSTNGSGNGTNNGNGDGSGDNDASTSSSQSPNQGIPTDIPSNSSGVLIATSSIPSSSSSPTNNSSGSVLTNSPSNGSADTHDDSNNPNNPDSGSEFGAATGAQGAIGGVGIKTSVAESTTRSFTVSGTGGGHPTATVGNTPGTDDPNESSAAGGLSKGAIAGIVILVFFFLLAMVALGVIVTRRRLRARRKERQNRWWFAHKHNSDNYDNGAGEKPMPARRSVRSSFETTFDRSQTPRLDLNLNIPPLPPVAEIRGEPLLINLDSPQITVQKPEEQSRFSVGSVSSVGSDGQAQYLYVDRNSLLKPELGTPMSVRPFSPTESFAFPKPPTDSNSGDWGSQFSRPLSTNTFATRSIKSPVEIPPTPVNPFADPLPGPNSKPFANPRPPTPTSPSAVNPSFLDIETIRRPFVPILGDELPVATGDKVKILQMFDDGWALVEKNAVIPDPKGKGNADVVKHESEKGLIPIDCFRDAGVDVSEFIAAKRVSSYSQTSAYNPGVAI